MDYFGIDPQYRLWVWPQEHQRCRRPAQPDTGGTTGRRMTTQRNVPGRTVPTCTTPRGTVTRNYAGVRSQGWHEGSRRRVARIVRRMSVIEESELVTV